MESKDLKVVFKEAFDKAYQETAEKSSLRFAELIKDQEQDELTIQVIQAIQEMQEKLKDPSNLHLVWPMLSTIWRMSSKKTYKPDFIETKLTSLLPEELQSDLNTLHQRWIKKGLSFIKIRLLTYKHLIHMNIGLIIVKIENYWLLNRKSEEDIE